MADLKQKKYVSSNAQLMAEWDFNKNNQLKHDPHVLTEGSGVKVWWLCSKCGYSWQTAIGSRAHLGSGCPKCAPKESLDRRVHNYVQTHGSLADKIPELAAEWHPRKNIPLMPTDVSVKSGKEVWWLCHSCNNEWKTRVADRVSHPACPYCIGHRVNAGINDLATVNPLAAAEWLYEKNEGLTPQNVNAYSGKKVWWKCSECGNEWQTKIYLRSRGSGCRRCYEKTIGKRSHEISLSKAGSLSDNCPEILKEWDYDKNDISPSDVTIGADTLVWWICVRGHSWKASVRSRTTIKTSCPYCICSGTSLPEQYIYYYIKKFFPEAKNRCHMKGITEIDVYIPSLRLAIEYDSAHWHKSETSISRDIRKNLACQNHDIILLRIREYGCKTLGPDSNEYYFNGQDGLQNTLYDIFSFINQRYKLELVPDIGFVRDSIAVLECTKQQEIENSLSMRFPKIAAEWHPIKNGKLKPENFTVSNGRKVWWKCSICGNEWFTTIASRTAGCGCPACSLLSLSHRHNESLIQRRGSLAENNPWLAKEWHPTKNNQLLPSRVTKSSGKKVWWLCSQCLGEWEAAIASRNSGVGCPYCARINK